MFKNLSEFLTTEEETIDRPVTLEYDKNHDISSRELQVATVALLTAAGQSNQEFSHEELIKVLGNLFLEFGLHDADGVELMEIAEFLYRKRQRLDEFINAINLHYSEEQKIHLLALVWRVIAADNSIDQMEGSFAADLRKRLNLSLEQAVQSQRRAQEINQKTAFLSRSKDEEESQDS